MYICVCVHDLYSLVNSLISFLYAVKALYVSNYGIAWLLFYVIFHTNRCVFLLCWYFVLTRENQKKKRNESQSMKIITVLQFFNQLSANSSLFLRLYYDISVRVSLVILKFDAVVSFCYLNQSYSMRPLMNDCTRLDLTAAQLLRFD